jgi:hypothetical protein
MSNFHAFNFASDRLLRKHDRKDDVVSLVLLSRDIR